MVPPNILLLTQAEYPIEVLCQSSVGAGSKPTRLLISKYS